MSWDADMQEHMLDCTAPTGTLGKFTAREHPDPKLTLDNLWAAIDQARVECLKSPVPDGWITMKQYQDRHGIAEKLARTELAKMVAAGKLQTRIVVVSGHRCRIWGLA